MTARSSWALRWSCSENFRRQARLSKAVRPSSKEPPRAAIGPAGDRQAVGAAAHHCRAVMGCSLWKTLSSRVPSLPSMPSWVLRLSARAIALGVGLVRGPRRHCARCSIGRSRRVVALQQRVPLELALDEGLQFEMGELKKLDRLQQLRRHHQGLALAQAPCAASSP